MFGNRLTYRMVLVFLLFFVLVLGPYTYMVFVGLDRLVSAIGSVAPLTPEQTMQYLEYRDGLVDDILYLSIYVLLLSLGISLFFSKRLLGPMRELYAGLLEMKAGHFGIRLELLPGEEFGELHKAFNDAMVFLDGHNSDLLKLREYLNAVIDPIFVMDEDGVIVDMNPAFENMFGYDAEAARGMQFYDFLDDEDEKTLRRKLYDVEMDGHQAYEVSVISRKEGPIPVLLSFSNLVVRDEPSGRIGIVRDFRRETALREALRSEKEYSEAIMDSMVDQLLIVDREFRVQGANMAVRIRAGRDITGETCHEMLYGSPGRCYMKGDTCPVKAVLDANAPYREVLEYKGADGLFRHYDIQAFPVNDNYGGIRSVVQVLRDVTDRVAFEKELDARNRELAALNSISRVLTHSLKSGEIYKLVMHKMFDLFSMDGGGLFFLDEMGRKLKAVYFHGLSEKFLMSMGDLPLGQDVPGLAAATGTSIYIEDMEGDPRSADSLFRHSGMRSFTAVPIHGKEKIFGVYVLFCFRAVEFTEEDKAVYESISEMMGISFENIRLYERMRLLYDQDRQRRAEEQKSLLALSSMLASTLDMDKVLTSCLRVIRQSCRADMVWYLDLNEKGEAVFRASTTEGLSEPGEMVYTSAQQSIERSATGSREPVMASGIAHSSRIYLDKRLRQYSMACCIPVQLGEKNLGAFTLYYVSDFTLSEEQIHFLRTLASLISVALERARLYENVAIQRGMADTILESIADGVVTMDAFKRVVSMNRAAHRIVGEDGGGALVAGRNMAEMRDDLDFWMRLSDAADGALAGETTHGEITYERPGGPIVPVHFTCSPIRDNKRNAVGVVAVIRDLTGERRADALKSDFLRSVSNEFRTPLTAIVGLTEMVLEAEVQGERADEYLRTVLTEAGRLSRMVGDVLDVAMIESGRMPFEPGDMDLRTVGTYLGEIFQDSLRRKSIEIAYEREPGLDVVRADEEKIKQLLRNLVDNAISYNDGGGAIGVGIRADGDFLVITVSDSGWGMSADDLAHMGRKFYRSPRAAGTKGTGLGISLCMDIARMHGGTLDIQSESGKGTIVTVHIPIGRGDS